MERFLTQMQDITAIPILFRLLLAMLCGGIIGMERGVKGRAAGFRTYMLVCVGAALMMITNLEITKDFNTDPARLGAQVISGTGFLGAGTIIVTQQNHVIGLTTAAGLWASACMGLAIGVGFYEGALLGSTCIFFIITFMNKLDRWATSKSKYMDMYLEIAGACKPAVMPRSLLRG